MTQEHFTQKRLPSTLVSEIKMTPDVPGALRTLTRNGGMDLAEMLGLSPWLAEETEV